VSCDVRARTEVENPYGSRGLCTRGGAYNMFCEPSSPFSLSAWRGHVCQPTNDDGSLFHSQHMQLTTEERRLVTIKSWAAQIWQQGVYRKVNRRMRLLSEEFDEEMNRLRHAVDGLRSLRKQLLTERHD